MLRARLESRMFQIGSVQFLSHFSSHMENREGCWLMDSGNGSDFGQPIHLQAQFHHVLQAVPLPEVGTFHLGGPGLSINNLSAQYDFYVLLVASSLCCALQLGDLASVGQKLSGRNS